MRFDRDAIPALIASLVAGSVAAERCSFSEATASFFAISDRDMLAMLPDIESDAALKAAYDSTLPLFRASSILESNTCWCTNDLSLTLTGYVDRKSVG